MTQDSSPAPQTALPTDAPQIQIWPPRPAWMALAVLTGCAVPTLVFGKAAIAVAMIPAFLLLFAFSEWKQAFLAGKSLLKRPVGIAFIVTAICWLGGVFHTLNFRLSSEAWARTLLLAYVLVVVAHIFANRQAMELLALRTLLVFCTLSWVLSFLGIAIPEVLGLIHGKGWVPLTVANGLRQYASAAMLLVPVALWAGFRLGGRWRWYGALNAIALVGIQIGAESRSSIAGLCAMGIAVGTAVIWKRGNLRHLFAFFALTTICLAAILLWLHNLTQFDTAEGMSEASAIPTWLIDLPRQDIWTYTWKCAIDSPWIGYGINTINYLPGANEPISGLGTITHISGHPHNWVLEIFGETGLLGLIPFLALIALVFCQLIGCYLRTGAPAYLAALAVNAGYWCSGLFNFSFWSVWWQVAYFTLFALTWAGRHPIVPSESHYG